MKVFTFQGGLGNQMFGYAFYLYMKKKYPHESMYGYYPQSLLSEHHGLEIDKWFDIEMPKSNLWSKFIVGINYGLKRLIGNHRWIETSSRECKKEDAKVFLAYKYTGEYIPEGEWLRWKVDDNKLSEKNRQILDIIRNTNSWFIHVRRGDYLSPRYKTLYEGCCPLEYYIKSIMDVVNCEQDPIFVCFSDDINWAKENLPKVNIRFVDWNNGADSPLDMYLMSNCCGGIIANSTFSYWGARLGKIKKVYYPTKWINSKFGVPKIFPESWKTY